MIVNVAELTGTALDWAVASCEGRINADGTVLQIFGDEEYSPSENAAQGLAIIQREGIALRPYITGAQWDAEIESDGFHSHSQINSGPMPLVAAMRCYVASKVGAVIEVPSDLLQ